jgi:hypothetical protein
MSGRGRLAAHALVALFAVGVLATAMAVPVLGATPRRTWNAGIGGYNAAGSATLALYGSMTAGYSVGIAGLKPNTTYAQIIYIGTCAHPITVAKLSSLRTDGSGLGTRAATLNATVGADIWGTAYYHSIGIRIASGTEAHCAVLSYRYATRIAISRYGINLPILKQIGNAYPLCNVALYEGGLSQPGEAGQGQLFAHARVGMFLPLLNASLVNNGASMVGTTVDIWMSDSTLLVYRISQVLRHSYSLPSVSPSSEHLYLQTSEGPHGTANKLLIALSQTGSVSASYVDAHPTPHPIICGF